MFTKTYNKCVKNDGVSKDKSDSHNKYYVKNAMYLPHLPHLVSLFSLTHLLKKLEIVAEVLFLPVMVGLALLFLVLNTAIWG